MDTLTSGKLHDCRDAFVAVLERLGAENPRVVAVCNDSVGSSKLGGFKAKWPERLVNVGIAEQNMVGVGAGLANGGLLPFVCAAACFLTGRALEQIKADGVPPQWQSWGEGFIKTDRWLETVHKSLQKKQ